MSSRERFEKWLLTHHQGRTLAQLAWEAWQEAERSVEANKTIGTSNGMWTPDEAARLLANRPNQPHYIKAVVQRCIDAATFRGQENDSR